MDTHFCTRVRNVYVDTNPNELMTREIWSRQMNRPVNIFRHTFLLHICLSLVVVDVLTPGRERESCCTLEFLFCHVKVTRSNIVCLLFRV